MYSGDRYVDVIKQTEIELGENTIYMVGRPAIAEQGQHRFHQSSWQHSQLSSRVINLGVTINGPLTMSERSCAANLPYVIYQLRQLRVIRGSLSTETCTALVHAFASSRLDYCNSLFARLSDDLINKV